MAKKNNFDLGPVIQLATLGAFGIGGYFIWKKFFKEEEEEGANGFWIIKSPETNKAEVGSLISEEIIGKNYEKESYLCFIKIVNQETGELMTPIQSSNVNSGLSRPFNFEFNMPDKESIRLNIHSGRIINNEEQIDCTKVWTISSEEGYPKPICRDPYCFDVNNSIEEIQMNEFLGIVPQGMDLDSYLENATQEQLDYWKDGDGGITFNGWFNIWNSLHRQDIVEFVMKKYYEYSKINAKLLEVSFT